MEKKSDSVSYTFRLPRSLKNAIAEDAVRNSRSVNAHFVKIMEQYLAGELIPVRSLMADPSVRNFSIAIANEAVAGAAGKAAARLTASVKKPVRRRA